MALTNRRAVYLYDGSFEGFLSAVFEAWPISRESFGDIKARENETPSFMDDNISLSTDPEKVIRVLQWIRGRLPAETEERIYAYFLSEDECRERRIFFYLRACHRLGKWVDSYLTDPAVADFLAAEKRFLNEAHRMRGFTRFRFADGRILISEIATDYNQLAGLGAFFLERMPGQRFILADKKRRKAVLSNGYTLVMADPFSSDEIYQRASSDPFDMLWKGYLQAMTIEERKNDALQRQLLPMKYRKYMTEFQ